MKTIAEIKEECIDIDLANIRFDNSIGVSLPNKDFLQFEDEKDIRIYYSNINLKQLLKIYSQYMGLSCLEQEESLEKFGYTLSITDIINQL